LLYIILEFFTRLTPCRIFLCIWISIKWNNITSLHHNLLVIA